MTCGPFISDQTPAQHRQLESRSFSVQRCLLNGCSLSFVLMVLLLLLYALLYTELAGKIASTHVDSSTSTMLYYSEVHGPNSAFVMHTHGENDKTYIIHGGKRDEKCYIIPKCFYYTWQDIVRKKNDTTTSSTSSTFRDNFFHVTIKHFDQLPCP